MVFCRKALGEGDHVHLSGLGSLFLVIMTAQAVIIGLGWSPETTLRRCRRSTPAAAELEEREQGSQPAKRVEVGGGGKGGACAPRALCPVPLGFSGGLAPRAGGGAPPPEGAAAGGTRGGGLSSEKPLATACKAPHPDPHLTLLPPYPSGPLLSSTHDESRNASGLNLALENYTGEPTAPGDKPG